MVRKSNFGCNFLYKECFRDYNLNNLKLDIPKYNVEMLIEVVFDFDMHHKDYLHLINLV